MALAASLAWAWAPLPQAGPKQCRARRVGGARLVTRHMRVCCFCYLRFIERPRHCTPSRTRRRRWLCAAISGEQLAHSISHSPSALFFGSSPPGSGLRLLLRREEEARRQRRAHGLTPAGARVHAKQHVHRCGQREHARTVHRLGRAACAMHAPVTVNTAEES